MPKTPQSFATHTQWTPFYHYFTSPMAGIFFTWSTMRLIDHPNVDTAYAFVGSLAVLACALMLRVSALKVQDRVIRLEERLRFARILPADLQARIEELRPSHLVALRFASDAEVADLVRKVLANPQMSQKDIKLLVRDWRADYFRA
jgi:hypothetical protein